MAADEPVDRVKKVTASKVPAKPKAPVKASAKKLTESDLFLKAATEALERANEEMHERTHAIDNLAHEVNLSNENLDRVGSQLGRFALRSDVARRRRVSTIRIIYLMVCAFVVMICLTSYKVERCSPGARAQRVAIALLRDPVDVEHLRSVVRQPAPVACDVVFPLYAHEITRSWPTPPNVAGFAIYLFILGAGGYASRRRPWENLNLSDKKEEELSIP